MRQPQEGSTSDVASLRFSQYDSLSEAVSVSETFLPGSSVSLKDIKAQDYIKIGSSFLLLVPQACLPCLRLFSSLLLGVPLFKTPEGVVVGFQIFAWAPI